MVISVTDKSIKGLLQDAKNQSISIAITNHSGRWSEEYFKLKEIREFEHGGEQITILLLCSPKDSKCTALDTRLIHGIKFDKHLWLNGNLVDEIKILFKDRSLQL